MPQKGLRLRRDWVPARFFDVGMILPCLETFKGGKLNRTALTYRCTDLIYVLSDKLSVVLLIVKVCKPPSLQRPVETDKQRGNGGDFFSNKACKYIRESERDRKRQRERERERQRQREMETETESVRRCNRIRELRNATETRK